MVIFFFTDMRETEILLGENWIIIIALYSMTLLKKEALKIFFKKLEYCGVRIEQNIRSTGLFFRLKICEYI